MWLKTYLPSYKEHFGWCEADSNISIGYLEKLIGGELVVEAGEINNMDDQGKFSICDVGDKPMPSDHSNITNRGLSAIAAIGLDIGYGVHEKLLAKTFQSPPIISTRHSIQPFHTWENANGSYLRCDEVKLPRCSQAPTFDIKADCLYLGEYIEHQKERKIAQAPM